MKYIIIGIVIGLLIVILLFVFRKRIREYYENHPKFRIKFNEIDAKINSLSVLYWIGAALYIAAVALALYLKLPNKYKVPVTTIVSTGLTALVIPLILNNIQLKKERQANVYEQNLPFYRELIDKMLDVLHETEQKSQRRNIVRLSNFIAQEYTSLCIKLPAYHLELLFNIKDECKLFFASNEKAKASIENIRKYAKTLILEIRKQGRISGKIYINDFMAEIMDMPEPGNMNPPTIS